MYQGCAAGRAAVNLCEEQADIVQQADVVQSCEDQADVRAAATKSAKNKWRFADSRP